MTGVTHRIRTLVDRVRSGDGLHVAADLGEATKYAGKPSALSLSRSNFGATIIACGVCDECLPSVQYKQWPPERTMS